MPGTTMPNEFGSEHADTALPRQLGQRVGGTEDDRGEGPLGGQCMKHVQRRLCCEYREVRRGGQCRDVRHGVDHGDVAALEPAGAQVRQCVGADVRVGTDHGDEVRMEQVRGTEAARGFVARQVHGLVTITLRVGWATPM